MVELDRIYNEDALTLLKKLPDGIIQTCVTSPPYWGLRDYGIEGQLGLEKTPEEYVAKMVEVFSEVRRVLRNDGTLWLNLGDSYAGSGRGRDADGTWNPGKGGSKQETNMGAITGRHVNAKSLSKVAIEAGAIGNAWVKPPMGYKAKDLIGIPWMVAFALRADGWYLRQDIIWAKPNPMPESVRDRCTKSHEYIFLFAKGQWKSRIVTLANLYGERFHFLQSIGLEMVKPSQSFAPTGANHSSVVELAVRLASTIFYAPQSEKKFALPPFYSEVWQKSASGSDSDFVCGLPKHHWPAVLSARFLRSDCTTKEFFGELYGMGVTLTDSNNFLIRGIDTKMALPPSISSDGKGTIGVHHSGEICEFDFLHGTIIRKSPSGCNYYYDSDAIKEPGTLSSLARLSQDVENQIGSTRANGGRKTNGMMKAVGKLDKQRGHSRRHAGFNDRWDDMSKEEQCSLIRNKRDVWTVATQPFKAAHFATFPPDLIAPCILAGSRIGDIVLDPFMGAGTTALVAARYGRRFIGAEINPEYIKIAEKRIRGTLAQERMAL